MQRKFEKCMAGNTQTNVIFVVVGPFCLIVDAHRHAKTSKDDVNSKNNDRVHIHTRVVLFPSLSGIFVASAFVGVKGGYGLPGPNGNTMAQPFTEQHVERKWTMNNFHVIVRGYCHRDQAFIMNLHAYERVHHVTHAYHFSGQSDMRECVRCYYG